MGPCRSNRSLLNMPFMCLAQSGNAPIVPLCPGPSIATRPLFFSFLPGCLLATAPPPMGNPETCASGAWVQQKKKNKLSPHFTLPLSLIYPCPAHSPPQSLSDITCWDKRTCPTLASKGDVDVDVNVHMHESEGLQKLPYSLGCQVNTWSFLLLRREAEQNQLNRRQAPHYFLQTGCRLARPTLPFTQSSKSHRLAGHGIRTSSFGPIAQPAPSKVPACLPCTFFLIMASITRLSLYQKNASHHGSTAPTLRTPAYCGCGLVR